MEMQLRSLWDRRDQADLPNLRGHRHGHYLTTCSSMRPNRRPPRQKLPKNSHYVRGGLCFGRITGEGNPHPHATSTTNTISAADGSHADRLWRCG